MHCLACDALLKDHELLRVGKNTKEPLDLCDHCLETISDDVLDDAFSGYIYDHDPVVGVLDEIDE